MVIRKYFLLLFLGLILVATGCNETNTIQQSGKLLYHPEPNQIELVGAILKVNDGVMVLVQNGPLTTSSTIIIPANDSCRKVVTEAYTEKQETAYQSDFKLYGKLTGSFIREDSTLSIFKYYWVVLLDGAAEQQEIQQMEE